MVQKLKLNINIETPEITLKLRQVFGVVETFEVIKIALQT